ncbi:protein-glutamate O-methyltransferase CheR [Paenibacillus antri]|uniref:protein-glutamate O-methyltransferase n=1 Tax=Paenibacillus antri TaxID=2582848 RepID=A0A5R9G4X0_9BACL|nr:protein-glutamate O-methyltransferase CheR [Paenibacillus antri]TLS49376.1 protein-glutamate O-methyltransferase CheR [Paenibacillus antri]
MTTLTEQEYRHLAGYIKKYLGIHLGTEKKTLVQSRLLPALEQRRMSSFGQYVEYLERDGTGVALRELAARLTTNHTYFNREAEHFVFLRDQVLPYLERTVPSRDLRIWSAGCSYGQEPYTLAMLLADYFGANKASWDTKLLATDISPKAIEHAKGGVYKREDVLQLPERWRRAYFQSAGIDSFAVVPKVKNEVLFRTLNLIHPFPFRRPFHVIFCRNVMIYFDAKLRAELLHKFYDALAPGGYLFIGHSESIPRDETKFEYVMPAVYRK